MLTCCDTFLEIDSVRVVGNIIDVAQLAHGARPSLLGLAAILIDWSQSIRQPWAPATAPTVATMLSSSRNICVRCNQANRSSLSTTLKTYSSPRRRSLARPMSNPADCRQIGYNQTLTASYQQPRFLPCSKCTAGRVKRRTRNLGNILSPERYVDYFASACIVPDLCD